MTIEGRPKTLRLGVSSETLLAVYLGVEPDRVGVPHDDDDWERCENLMDLLKLSSSQRSGLLWRTSRKYPEWLQAERFWRW